MCVWVVVVGGSGLPVYSTKLPFPFIVETWPSELLEAVLFPPGLKHFGRLFRVGGIPGYGLSAGVNPARCKILGNP